MGADPRGRRVRAGRREGGKAMAAVFVAAGTDPVIGRGPGPLLEPARDAGAT